jgi:hypothetical protein
MRVSVAQRALSALVFLLAAGSMAAVEPVHGIAHHEAAHHRDAHHHDAAAGLAAVLPNGDDAGHVHALVEQALRTRAHSWTAALPEQRVVLDGFERVHPAPVQPLFVIHRWSSTHAPPPPPRAPPA